MPLILLSGFPSSGKSTRTKELEEFFLKKGKIVKVISENLAVPKAGFQKNEIFADSQKEKTVRADLKSETIRILNNNDVVILDAGNYIKGYRYEIYCASKSVRATQCTIYCAITKEKGWELNQKRIKTEQDLTADITELNNSDVAYSEEIYNALCLRFEEPHGNSRWDSPLFTVFPDDILNLDEIYSSLYEMIPPKPNKSTQNPPLSETNYLYELNNKTQEIINTVISSRKIGILGPVGIQNIDIKINVPSDLNAAQLNRLRRQFINFSKTQSSCTDLDKIPKFFVQFLNSNFNRDE